MKGVGLTLLLANAVSILFVCGGIYLASVGKEGWGWCFFFAVLCHVTYSKQGDGGEDTDS